MDVCVYGLCESWCSVAVVANDVSGYRYIHGWLGATIDCIPEGCVFGFGGGVAAAATDAYHCVIALHESVLSLVVRDLRAGGSNVGAG